MQDKNQIEIILADRKAGKIYVLRIFKKPMPQRHQAIASLKEASDVASEEFHFRPRSWF